ncbi:MAG TPA: hypothetical protein VMP68_07720 [Candidatus Eisenbacteria bacterium]|nr:hypothetical protein [Candidatus Eisenbacteria bacterium]
MPPFDGQIPPALAGLLSAGGGASPAPGGAPAPVPGAHPPLPPGLMGGPPAIGPMMAPQGNPGNALAAASKVKSAVTLLQEALPAIPMGSDVHNDVLKAVGMLAKHAENQPATDQSQITQLMALIQRLATQQPNAALQRMAQPASPNAPPALPPPPAPMPGGPAGAPGVGAAA